MTNDDLKEFLELMHHDINNTFGIFGQHLGNTRKEVNKTLIDHKESIEELNKRVEDIEGYIIRLARAVNVISEMLYEKHKYKDPTNPVNNLPN